jgi:TonB family protein
VHNQFNRVVESFIGRFHIVVLLVCLFCVGVSNAQESSRKAIAKTTPVCPELAKKLHLTGKVKVEVVVSAHGSVTSARLVGGNPVFERSAIDAVKQWKFEPAEQETKVVIVLEYTNP